MIAGDFRWPRRLTGMAVLLRPVATFSWTGGACLLAAGLAMRAAAPMTVVWLRLLRVFAVGVVVQGWLAHSLNDRTDWATGTDRNAKEYFSAGSGVLRLGYFAWGELGLVAAISLGLTLALAWSRTAGPALWALLLVGLWGAIAYSCRPWRLSYHPFTGEWLAAFPAVTACSLATYLALVGQLSSAAVAASVLHGLLCVCWLMQHHLPDWSRDLGADPPKLTTVAAIARCFGLPRARLVGMVYYLLTALVAAVLSLFYRSLLWTGLIALFGAILAWRQNVFQRRQVAMRELQMISLTILNALLVGWIV